MPESAETVSGRVTEAEFDDYGVPGVTVQVEGSERSAVTNADGRFTLEGVADGPVVLLLDAPDYAAARVQLSPEARARPVAVALTWEGGEVTELTVPARAQPETASTTQLTPRDIDSAPRRNAEEVLRQVPGLTLVQHGSEGKGHQFFMRGFDAIHGADLELTLDGLPLNEWSNIHAQGYLDLALIIPELIQGVVVTKGPFTLEQGAFAMAGSADFQLGTPLDERGWRAAYTAGTTNRHRVFTSYSPAEGDGQQFVGIEATHDDGFGDRRRIDRGTFNGRVRLFDLGAGGAAYLTGLGSYSAFELPGTLRNDDVEAGLVDFRGAYDPLARGTSARGLASLRYAWERDDHEFALTGYGGYRRLELLENFTGFLINPEHGDRRDQVQETGSFGLIATHESRLLESLALRTGLGLRGDVFSQRERSVGQGLELLAERRELDGVQLIAHALAGLRWTPGERVRIDAGARVDMIHVGVRDGLEDDARGGDTLAVVSPRLTAEWSPRDRWGLFLAYGRGFRPPEARAFSSFDPNRVGLGDEVFTGGAPVATVSDGVELGTRWSPAAWLGFSLAGFATFIERESVFDHVSGVNLDLNGTRRLGGELVLSSSPLPWLSLSADLTMVDARFVGSGARVPFAPWLTAGARAVVTHDSGFRAGLRALTVAPRTLPHGARGATMVRTDATLGYRWRWLRVDLEVENLINQALREGEYHYASHWRPGEPAREIPVLHTTAGPPINARLTLGVQF
ncbi:TonB-dependent receptor [Plesiocystis pacifica SIR-1]|uniref:TonB-dependent receptor n=1 Tax=Plesiocystis pacifica SIR-1 TaxID=391625 RepID=A6G2I3_9BACT|nr:TonB-dependent receptor [Plesiocystis pacifica]EDM79920.1 TonB-dependent receptor [Plesiocystis pacifica SIR-1]